MKGAIYYTDNRIETSPIIKVCREQIRKTFSGELISVSLGPIDLGKNYVLDNRQRSYPTMVKQILMALEKSTADYVFFLEHDCLYPECHFDFVPPTNDIFYYNSNILRWGYLQDHAISYDRLMSLSCMCANRELALDHYRQRTDRMDDLAPCEWRSREPRMGRVWGYEPGTKKRKRGGFSDDDYDVWYSEIPVVDIRHRWTFSSPKLKQENFTHQPTGWKEMPIGEISGWNLRTLFNVGGQ